MRSCSTIRSRADDGSSCRSSGRPQVLLLIEAPLATDKDSASPDAFPAFHGYGVSGDVTGQVVYANYGRPEDFAALEKMGIDVKDKIVLVRYGELFRGLKVRNAQKRGAKGILIYSDPADDGYAKGDVYPAGPLPARVGDPARQRAVPVARAGRSLDAGLALGQGGEAAADRSDRRLPARRDRRFRRSRESRRRGVGEGDRPEARRLLRDDPLAADQLRRGPADPRGAGRPERARGLAGGLAAGLPRRAGAGRGPASRSRWITRSARSGT